MFAKAQSKTDSTFYTKATDLVIGGQITPTKNPYHRVDTANYPGLSKAIKLLLTNSAGKFVSFSTNSKNIMAKWCVSNKKQYPNLTPIANKGLDIYIKKNGKWQFAGAAGPNGLCTEAALVKDMDDSEKECLVYLPIYDEASNVEIGIDKSATIKPMPDPFKKRILIYGSSVTQGAAASRPGMAYLARLSRETGLNFLNLGLSGNGKMEPAAAVMVAGIDADAYILDCVGNPSPQQIIERTNNMVLTIRKAHPKAPIIMMEGTVREHGYFNQSIGKMVKQQNINFEQQYKILLQQGVTDLYLIKEADWLGTDHEGTIDGSHPNDLGFDRMLHIIKPQIVAILKKYGLN
jgi:lysophospholipase L1-like esterase